MGNRYGFVIEPCIKLEPNTMNEVAPSAAPAETPMRPGSAKGFLNSPWRHAPDVANEAPTKADSKTLGKRIVVKTDS